MSESKYRALLASIAASEGRGVDWAAEIEAALAEPPVQADPFWYAVVSNKAPVINKAIKRNDVAMEYASQCSHEDVMIIPLYLHPPAAQVTELVEALERITRVASVIDYAYTIAKAALAKYKGELNDRS